jgi:hypothetical protein
MSYLRYLCLFAHSGVQHILRCVFVLFVFVLCTLCYQFLWIMSACCKVYSRSNQSIHIGNLILAIYYVNVKDC